MKFSLPSFALFACVFGGCASVPVRSLPADHPANPQATEAMTNPPSTTLRSAIEAPALGQMQPAVEGSEQVHKMDTPQPVENRTEPGKQLYTCPMHPEVIRDAPGKCPKCGMELVPKKPSGAAK